MRHATAALAVSGPLATAVLGASLEAVDGPSAAQPKPVASFSVTVLRPLEVGGFKMFRVALDVTNTCRRSGLFRVVSL